MEVLGCQGVVGQRKLTDKELGRISSAEQVMILIGSLPITKRMREVAVQCLALSRAAYGWVVKGVPGTVSDSLLQTAVGTVGSVVTRANTYAKKFFLGGTLDVRCVVLQLNIVQLQTMLWSKCRPVQWHRRWGTFVRLVRDEMRKFGWIEVNEFHWEHTLAGTAIKLGRECPGGPTEATGYKKMLAHMVRDGYRKNNFSKRQQSRGRVAKQLKHLHHDADVLEKVRQRFYAEDGVGRAVLCGGWVSPAARWRAPDKPEAEASPEAK